MDQAAVVCLLLLLISLAFLYDQFTRRIPTRLADDQAPKSSFGLVPVGADNLPATASGIDIIFVHGLGSNPDTTWRARRPVTTDDALDEALSDSKRYVTWISDFLPDDLPSTARRDVRMFFYNYDSYWKRDAVQVRLWNLGNSLLEHINGEIRLSERERSRGLIFVGYSYGGLVVKQALIHAHQNPSFGYIAECTKAILFLGTPHRGSSFGALGRLAAQALRPLGSNPSILAEVADDSTSLLDLHRAFVDVVRDGLRVFNFFEQRPTQILRLWFVQWQQFCVREQSATYEGQGVRNIGLPGDHCGLNKFGSRNESYRAILLKLTEIIASSPPATHHYSAPLETVQSYTQRDELWKELEGKLQIRHENASVPHAVAIHGLGGAGKSQLALGYAEKQTGRYNPILWIDATDEEAVRSSFVRCAAELGLAVDRTEKQESAVDTGAVRAVLRWLRDRTEADDEWLFIIDNADDFSWGVKKIVPKGNRGSIIITSQDDKSPMLIPSGCERIRVDVMTQLEATKLLLQRLPWDADCAPENIRQRCNEVAQNLGCLPLAVDLAGAYIGNDSKPEQALMQYLADFDRHRDELLQMEGFRGLLPTEKTVWTVWDTTLEKITKEHAHLQPGVLLTFLAHFNGSIIQDELFRLAATGSTATPDELIHEIPEEIMRYCPLDEGEWDSFLYRQSCDVLLRYGLLQRADGDWTGVTMHGLVRWRAIQSDRSRPWRWWYVVFILAACHQIIEEEHQPEFRRHLIAHFPDMDEDYTCGIGSAKGCRIYIWEVLGEIYFEEGRWGEAEKLSIRAREIVKTEFGVDHPMTLQNIARLAMAIWSQGRWKEAEQLQLLVLETCKMKLGVNHPDTLKGMGNLAITLASQGRREEAEKLFLQVLETYKMKLGVDHPDTLMCMGNLASTLGNQGRGKEAEKLYLLVLSTFRMKFGVDHPNTLKSMTNLAVTLGDQGRWEEAETLFIEVLETSKTKLGVDHPDTLKSMAHLATTLRNQGWWEEAEKLFLRVLETCKMKLGIDHPDTLSSMHDLALTWKERGRLAEGLALMKDCVQAQQRVLGPEHPYTLLSLAAVAKWSSKHVE